MQSASPSGRLQLDSGQALSHVRQSLSGGKVWSFVLVLLITLTVADSTSTFHWMNGIEVVVPIALLGAALVGALALTPIPEWTALVIGAVVAIPVAVLGAWPQIHLAHPGAQLGLGLVDLWAVGMKDGSLVTDSTFYLFLICLLMWVTGAWLSWCVLRWRKPMLGLIPGAAAFATNALNILPGMPDQNGFAFALIVLIIALLLWNNYATSVVSAVRAQVRLTGDAKWDFWESGIVAMLIVVVLSIFLPQMSKSDRTLAIESGIFTSWAQLQSEISHPGFISQGVGGGGATGFSDDVRLVGSISRNSTPVFIYQLSGAYGGPQYFGGLVITQQANGEWRYAAGGEKFLIGAGQPVTYGESYDALGVAAFTVTMLHTPNGFSTVAFYPGQLAKIDRTSTVREVPLNAFAPSPMMIDRLDVGSATTGRYTAYSEYSGATVAQLQAAGTDYPDWVKQFAVTPVSGYRIKPAMDRVRQLALDITANAQTPYDKATAIEDWLRTPGRFTYRLSNVPVDPNFDSLDYFLFHSKIGYCEYFATAMGDMLRSLGIPTVLVNGYGSGRFDSTYKSFVVRSDDAHTWVEAYFPGYGWIPFEPTPDDTNYPRLNRGQDANNVCFREAGCDSPDTTNVPIIGGTTGGTPSPHPKSTPTGGSSKGGFSIGSLFGPSLFTESLAAALAIVLILLLFGVRYLRPRTVATVWKRMLTLSSLAGAERRPGETPLELGRRLQRSFPEAAEPVAALTSGFAIAAYAPADDAVTARGSVMEAWTALRPHLLRRVFARLRPRTP